MAPRSEGMNLSPVELAVSMSEQTRTAAGHGLDLLGPVIIEGSPEALQTVAIQRRSLARSSAILQLNQMSVWKLRT